MAHILLIDDDPALIPKQVRLAFPAPAHRVEVAGTGSEGLGLVRVDPPDAILLDIRLPDQSGLDLYQAIRDFDGRIPVIFITIARSADAAIEAMRRGAYDYLFKPIDLQELRRAVDEALEEGRRMRGPATIAETPPDPDFAGAIVGTCPAMREVYKAIGRVSDQNVPVLITGESGTGKELVARAIYQHGRRARAPYRALNCAAIPESLLESELFGHERGAFTGADRKRIGKFEQCNGGTLFLDEVGDMTPALQAKMLRLLQDQEFERVGGNEVVRTDVRLIAATHRDLKAWTAEGKFRPDLYYRLSVVTIRLPPCASGATTFRCWCSSSCDGSTASWGETSAKWPRRPWSASGTIPGRGTFGNSRASFSRPCSGPPARSYSRPIYPTNCSWKPARAGRARRR